MLFELLTLKSLVHEKLAYFCFFFRKKLEKQNKRRIAIDATIL